MPTLSTLATSILLTLSVSSPTLAYSGDFAADGISTMPVLMQFDEGRGRVSARGTAQDHLPAPTAPEQGTQSRVQSSDGQVKSGDFQRYFARHFRAHLVLNASPQRMTNAQ